MDKKINPSIVDYVTETNVRISSEINNEPIKKEVMISKDKTWRQFYYEKLTEIHTKKCTSHNQFCEEIASCMIDPIVYMKNFVKESENLNKE